MYRKLTILALAAALALPACDRDDVDDEIDDVLEEHEEVVEQAERTPYDTAAIAEEVRERDAEQEEAARATRDAVRELQDTTVH